MCSLFENGNGEGTDMRKVAHLGTERERELVPELVPRGSGTVSGTTTLLFCILSFNQAIIRRVTSEIENKIAIFPEAVLPSLLPTRSHERARRLPRGSRLRAVRAPDSH